ncbi:MAG TPA: SpoIIE family protein phosphatase [Vicinamibacterales bacterium]|nr:SpoIIE family protein phosphatase [Vicinamibacterales bacterium]
MRIVIVDRDDAVTGMISADLERLGHAVSAASGDDEALAAADGNAADLVMLAVGRPGPESLRLLRALQGRANAAPVIVVADGATLAGELAARLVDGADDYVVVPVHPQLLQKRMAAVRERLMLRVAADTSLDRLRQLSHDLREVILPLGVSLSTEKNTERLLEQILLQAKAMCAADAATLYVRTSDDRLKFSIMLTDSLGVAHGGTTGKDIALAPLRLRDPQTGEPNHRNIASWVALHGRSVNIDDIYAVADFDFTATREFDHRNNYRSVSTLTVPLKNHADDVVAVLQLLNALDPVTHLPTGFDSYQQLVVESLASQAAVVFNNQILLQRQEALLNFEHDLQIGRQIQAGFLPEMLPAPPGWQLAARFMPAREVAGDFYDAFMLGPENLGFVVADVCDKGVGAALFMALVRSLVRVYVQQRYAALSAEVPVPAGTDAPKAADPGGCGVTAAALRQAIVLANDYIGDNHLSMNMFATMFAGVVNVKSGALQWVNAGHNAPMLLSGSGKVTRLPSKSPAVGMRPGFQFVALPGSLAPGDTLVVFSDGIPDARDPRGAFFTERRLLALVESMRDTPAEQAASDIQEQLVAHIATAAQFDDITLMVLRRLPLAGAV